MTEPDVQRHRAYMRQALDLAARAAGRTSPNPLVGAIVVKDGRVVGAGFHPKAGQPHAEVFALREAGENARGATVYVSLEPCSHTGRTPPCAVALVEAGVSRVYAAMEDPNPLVSGSGLRYLESHGVRTDVGIEAAAALELNRAFVKFVSTGLPWVEIKVAMSLDGKIATAAGHSRWVTGEPAREWVHRRRDRADAILVGANTVREDDPALTVRLKEHDGRQPLRAVLAGSKPIDPNAQVFRGPAPGAVLFCPEGVDWARKSVPGVTVAPVPALDGRLDLGAVLRWFGQHEVMDVLVEGGAAVNAAFLRAGLVDRVSAWIAPAIFGGQDARSGFDDLGVIEPAQGVRLRDLQVGQIGEDWLFQGRPEQQKE